MPPPPDEARFTPAERWVHRSTALLVAVLAATAAVLYYEPLAVLVDRRALVAEVHVVAGLLLPLPTLLGLLDPQFRADLGRLNRFLPGDGGWFRRHAVRTPGKFNPGQKLAAAVVAGAGLVLFGTGLVLLGPVRVDVPLAWRQGATLVHDLTAGALLTVLIGHIWLAYRHPEARQAMRIRG